MTKNEILALVEKVHALKKDASNTLPDNSYFLEENTVLCYPRVAGDSRYPYYNDGLQIFAHTSGYIDCTKGAYSIFRIQHFNEDAPIAFFAGEKEGETFFPVSVTGAARQLTEKNVERYIIYTPVCAYYITETEKAVFALRVYVDRSSHLRFSLCAINRKEAREIYLSSYFDPMLSYEIAEKFYMRMGKFSYHYDNGSFLLYRRAKGGVFNCLTINSAAEGTVTARYSTTARREARGRAGACLANSVPLLTGRYDQQIAATNTTDIAIASEMVHFHLEEGGFACIHYEMLSTESKEEAEEFLGNTIDVRAEDAALQQRIPEEKAVFDRLKIRFENWHNDGIHTDVLNNFIKCVQRQISLCALGDNYADYLLGIRDVFQQVEAALIWQPKEARRQIARVMNFILEDGRPPRQISFPSKERPIPQMDLRPFIDQGFWIISAIHTYLAYTDDFSILEEECGYYKALATMGPLENSTQRDDILRHLIRILDFLISNLDEETHCIHVLFGDWNDALDAMGHTTDKGKEYGTGVSVMATQQLYLAIEQLCEILKKTGQYTDRIAEYEAIRDQVAKGFMKYAVDSNQEGEKRVMHGWGDKRSYFVGSYKDYDGKSRISLTAQAFFAISDMVKRYPEMKEDIVKNILSLDSKYGLLTFAPEFEYYSPEVGRISGIMKGSAENSCAYIHAGTFAIMALFMMGHSKEAWEQFQKSLIISHPNATLTTFVMPNSYCYNEEFYTDGISMGDWYTGSGAVVVKELIRNGFGILPTLEGLSIAPPKYMPADQAEITLPIKGAEVTVQYRNKGEGTRKIYLNGTALPLIYDGISDTQTAFIPKDSLGKTATILITD